MFSVPKAAADPLAALLSLSAKHVLPLHEDIEVQILLIAIKASIRLIVEVILVTEI